MGFTTQLDRRRDQRLTLAIDASRAHSGGAVAHLIGICSEIDPNACQFQEIHIWSHPALLRKLPELSIIKKHVVPTYNKNILRQLVWQACELRRQIKQNNCDILLTTDASSVCQYEPQVVMSRDMLSFEKGEMTRYPLFSKSRLRLWIIKYLQIYSLKRATACIFLTQYACEVLQSATGMLKSKTIIPHGISEDFRQLDETHDWQKCYLRLIYVSSADLYKHHISLLQAVETLLKRGFGIELKLVGAATGPNANKLRKYIANSPVLGPSVRLVDFVDHSLVKDHIKESDIFLFVSSCENMPNTLIEGMAGGKAIVCSNRGPMPEVLGDAGLYCDPENPVDIAEAIEKFLKNPELMKQKSRKAYDKAMQYSWARCSDETLSFLKLTYDKFVSKGQV